MNKEEVQAACNAIHNISEELVVLREVMVHADYDWLAKDSKTQVQYQSLMIRGMGAALESIAMLLERVYRTDLHERIKLKS